ncbi:MAG TPA: GTP-binding protein [Clostridia bacterium]|nr:GTP-binding protein [Clostridia bacterium]
MDICKTLDDMNIVVVGHVDHGKSTVVGRMLADTNSLPEGKLEQVRENCRRNSKPFEYAFLLDALKDEQAQGITIDSARCFFSTEKRNYIIIDAPGHIEFLKNMVTGAARAEAALLVIAADEGVMENSNRHGYLLSMLGIRQVAVVINKMDLVDYSRDVYESIVSEYSRFLRKVNISAQSFIPVSGMMGDNVASLGLEKMPWYTGLTVLEQLDSFNSEGLPADMPFRMPVQDVYKFTMNNDNRRIVAGTVETGSLAVGDSVTFYPSGKRSSVRTIESFNTVQPEQIIAGNSAGFTLTDQIFITRGEIASRSDEKAPAVAAKLRTNVFWLGKEPFSQNKRYFIKIGTAKVECSLEKIGRVMNASNLNSEKKEMVERHEVAECIISLKKPVAFDLTDELAATSRFVLIDGYEISGGGIITGSMEDELSDVRHQVMIRNTNWIKSSISREDRAYRYKQRPSLIIITGPRQSGKKTLARELEKVLFQNGELVYFIGMGSVVYGVDADIKNRNKKNREEHIRRTAEIINIMLDSGMILILTAIELTSYDIELIKTIANPPDILTIWTGEEVTTDINAELNFGGNDNSMYVERICRNLADRGIIFKGI